MKVNIYISTSIRAPAKTKGCIEYILQAGDTDKTMTKFAFLEDATANESEVICLKMALSHINTKADMVLIHTDSSYMNLSLSALGQNQRFEDFKKTTKGKPRAYINEWELVHSILCTREWDIVFNQPNEFKKWLQADCSRRATEKWK